MKMIVMALLFKLVLATDPPPAQQATPAPQEESKEDSKSEVDLRSLIPPSEPERWLRPSWGGYIGRPLSPSSGGYIGRPLICGDRVATVTICDGQPWNECKCGFETNSGVIDWFYYDGTKDCEDLNLADFGFGLPMQAEEVFDICVATDSTIVDWDPEEGDFDPPLGDLPGVEPDECSSWCVDKGITTTYVSYTNDEGQLCRIQHFVRDCELPERD